MVLFSGEPKCAAYYDDFWIFGEGSGAGTSDPKDDQLIVDQGSDPAEQGSGSGEGSGDGGKKFSSFYKILDLTLFIIHYCLGRTLSYELH